MTIPPIFYLVIPPLEAGFKKGIFADITTAKSTQPVEFKILKITKVYLALGS